MAVSVPIASADLGMGGRSVGGGCAGQTYEQPFLPWVDPASYVLAPGGSLEGGAGGWTLSGGAAVVSGNEPFHIHGSGETSSLSLPAGSRATTSQMCATLLHPDLRFVARNTGSPLSLLMVEILFPGPFGNSMALPTAPLPFAVNALAVASAQGSIPIAFRFTPLGHGGNWQIDDVYVDPYGSE
jgi:hypothetical protein